MLALPAAERALPLFMASAMDTALRPGPRESSGGRQKKNVVAIYPTHIGLNEMFQ